MPWQPSHQTLSNLIKNYNMNLQEYINLINKAESIEQFCIDNKLKIASTDDGKYILNYAEQMLGTEKNWVSHYSRAITFAGAPNNYQLISKSFSRFYNAGEKPEYLGEHDDIDYTKPFDVQFKYDGSVISVYKYNDEICVQTRGSFATSDVTSIEPGLTWQKLFEQAEKTDVSNTFEIFPGITYIYELCSPYNQVVELYDTTFAKCLAGIYTDGIEIQNCFEGETYQCQSFEQVQDLLTTLKPTQEGFVIAQWDEQRQQYKRKKLKTKTWCELSHIKESTTNSVDKLWNCVFSGDKDEVSSVFVYLKPKLDQMWEQYQNCIAEVELEYSKINEIENQKEFASFASKSQYSGILFALRQNKTTAILGVQKHLTK
jgi:RNA ligase